MKIKYLKILNILFVSHLTALLIGVYSVTFSQIVNDNLGNYEKNKSYFYLDPVVFFSADRNMARLDFYIELPLSTLQFKKVATGKPDDYEANIEYSIIISQDTETGNEIVSNNYFTEAVTTTKNEQKRLEELSNSTVKSFYLEPGYYKIKFLLRDKNSKRELAQELSIRVKNFLLDDVTVSDMLLLSDYKELNGRKEISPLISSNVGNLKEFFVFFEIYNRKPSETPVAYKLKLSNDKGAVSIEKIYNYNLAVDKNQVTERFSTEELVTGEYKLELIDLTDEAVIVVKKLIFRWFDMPVNLKNLDIAIDQMIYIANTDEIEYIRSAPNNTEKERRFLKFWKARDPSPNTIKNETLIDYYSRINIANERYSHYVDGWKTDMGMVYIMYGEPSNIERHPFAENSKPYEIWDYYNLNRQFIFIDNTGFGDYRLLIPVWDDRTRIRY